MPYKFWKQKSFTTMEYGSDAAAKAARKAWIKEMESEGYTTLSHKRTDQLMQVRSSPGYASGMGDEEWTHDYMASAWKN